MLLYIYIYNYRQTSNEPLVLSRFQNFCSAKDLLKLLKLDKYRVIDCNYYIDHLKYLIDLLFHIYTYFSVQSM